MTPTFRVNFTQFDSTLREYMGVTTHSLADVLNRKGFFISRRAAVETPKADAAKIKNELGRIVRRGKRTIKLDLAASSDRANMSLAEAILRARIWDAGGTQPTKEAIMQKVPAFLSARMRSIAFFKSGYLPAIRKFDSVIHDRSGVARVAFARQIGSAKGAGIPARPGWRLRATIINSADARHDRGEALIKFGGPALQRAVDFEAKSMSEEIARRQAAEAKKLGIRVHES